MQGFFIRPNINTKLRSFEFAALDLQRYFVSLENRRASVIKTNVLSFNFVMLQTTFFRVIGKKYTTLSFFLIRLSLGEIDSNESELFSSHFFVWVICNKGVFIPFSHKVLCITLLQFLTFFAFFNLNEILDGRDTKMRWNFPLCGSYIWKKEFKTSTFVCI